MSRTLSSAGGTPTQREPEHLAITEALTDLGRCYGELADYATAKRHLRRALWTAEKLDGFLSLAVGEAAEELACVYLQEGDHDGAVPLLRRARLAYETLGPKDSNVGRCLALLARALGDGGDAAGALYHSKRALRIYEQTAGQDSPHLPLLYEDVAAWAEAANRHEEAEEALRRAAELRERHGDAA